MSQCETFIQYKIYFTRVELNTSHTVPKYIVDVSVLTRPILYQYWFYPCTVPIPDCMPVHVGACHSVQCFDCTSVHLDMCRTVPNLAVHVSYCSSTLHKILYVHESRLTRVALYNVSQVFALTRVALHNFFNFQVSTLTCVVQYTALLLKVSMLASVAHYTLLFSHAVYKFIFSLVHVYECHAVQKVFGNVSVWRHEPVLTLHRCQMFSFCYIQ